MHKKQGKSQQSSPYTQGNAARGVLQHIRIYFTELPASDEKTCFIQVLAADPMCIFNMK